MTPASADVTHEAELDPQAELIMSRGLGLHKVELGLSKRVVPDQRFLVRWTPSNPDHRSALSKGRCAIHSLHYDQRGDLGLPPCCPSKGDLTASTGNVRKHALTMEKRTERLPDE